MVLRRRYASGSAARLAGARKARETNAVSSKVVRERMGTSLEMKVL
jgi:hypothetical protein